MKELAHTFAQLTMIIALLLTLAFSTAAISQWANSESTISSAPPTAAELSLKQ
jgi:hypothetical protein